MISCKYFSPIQSLSYEREHVSATILFGRLFVHVCCEVMRTKKELKSTNNELYDTEWTLQELTNGGALPGMQLFRAGDLQLHIIHNTRNRLGDRLYSAADALNASRQQLW